MEGLKIVVRQTNGFQLYWSPKPITPHRSDLLLSKAGSELAENTDRLDAIWSGNETRVGYLTGPSAEPGHDQRSLKSLLKQPSTHPIQMELLSQPGQILSRPELAKGDSTTIHDLPPELISAILLGSLVTHRELCTDPACRGELLYYLLTSKSWRRLIESCALFWTTVDFHDSARTITQTLELNPQGPLDLTCLLPQWELASPNCAEQVEAFFKSLASVRHRWRKLDLHGPLTPTAIAIIQPAVAGMEECRLKKTISLGFGALRVEGEDVRIKHLILYGVDFDWTSPGIAALESLTVDASHADIPPPEVLAGVLASLPNLQWLRLSVYGRTPSWPPEGLPDYEPQPHPLRTLMPALTWLVFDGLPSRIFRFLLEIIDAPRCEYFGCASTEPSYRWLEHPSSPMKVLANRVMEAARRPVHMRYMEMEARLRIRSDSSSGDFLPTDRDRHGGLVGLDVSAHHPARHSAWKGLASFVASLPILPGQCSLELEASGVPGIEEFPYDVLFHWPAVSSLVFRNRWYTRRILEYLCTPQADDEGRLTWALPQLEYVDLACAEWVDRADVVESLRTFWEGRYGDNRGFTPEDGPVNSDQEVPIRLRRIVVPSKEEANAVIPIVGDIEVSVVLEKRVEARSRGSRLRR
ncbi:hypothetical protein M407DRAFT_7178 [Tulasnella calospora MUT 4182]|uniref:Uncharacterized protein n=1 Tax=Tulasnella calospora MUT 4182 TaxID=1051891 RepID=A0A0C3QB62_9AGAM|nr:hypothetical protein M407DRAFT_7178 [Tulasnella calospora MUT 4182]